MTDGEKPPATPRSAPLPALSTMWAVQPRFERDMPAFLDRAAELGYEAVEINHGMDAAQAGAILASGTLPVTGVHAPAPLEKHPSAGWNRGMNLAATDGRERSLIVGYTRRSIELAAQAGAGVVVVHLGGAGARMLRGERRLRGLFDRGEQGTMAWTNAVQQAREEREAQAAPYLEQAARSMAELAETASAHGVAIGLETRLHYHEIPLPREARELLAPYPVEVAGYLHDVGHAEVHHRLGLTDLDEWWDELGDRLVGLHLQDVRGITDHRAPGNGDVDLAALARRIEAANPSAARTFEIDQHEPDEDVASGLQLLREAGVVG